jgi:uncharacterized protein YjbJ (UPF0337 family)
MKTPTLVGIILIVLAVIAFSYQGITYTKREKVLDIGPIQATTEKKETIPLPPIVGAVALIGGVALVVVGSKHWANRNFSRATVRKERIMNWDQISGQWKQYKGRAKEKWGKLTDDEIDVIEGKRDQLVGKVQERYGIARDQAEKEVDQWAHDFWAGA